ncbi:MAG: hypothetical protein LAP38_23420 [Acidobacteriia bacterium]|nr:hypothetical protein [Terriglobia bacterium]
MQTPRYWRIMLKGGRKAHLARFDPTQWCGDVALCGQPLPLDKRRGSATTINEPLLNECETCLRKSGHLKKPPPTEEERRNELIMKTARFLIEQLGLTPSQVANVIRDAKTAKEKAGH